jgi:dTDP-4-dehydrorhamnose reductase
MTKFLVVGAGGQVGWELVRSLQPLGDVSAASRATVDLTSPGANEVILSLRPDVIVNAAAYTAVDKAESDESAARAVNVEGVATLSRCAEELGALLVHYSTDYVFSGNKADPYIESDEPDPLSVYGRTKLDGERVLATCQADWLCFRTSWVFAPRGKNFLRTILRLASEREELRIVADQYGAPTSARLIADVTAHAISAALRERDRGSFVSEILHLTASGSTSWYGFAQAILRHANRTSLGERLIARTVQAIGTADYPTPAKRPANSRLSCERIERRFGVQLPPWGAGVALCIDELAEPGLP